MVLAASVVVKIKFRNTMEGLTVWITDDGAVK
jgi:hypothetical protein